MWFWPYLVMDNELGNEAINNIDVLLYFPVVASQINFAMMNENEGLMLEFSVKN